MQKSNIDVLIVCALKEEFESAKAVGLKVGVSEWREHDAATSSPYLLGRYSSKDGTKINVALARPTRMGGGSTAPLTSSLVERLRPGCLTMCGVCAGNPSTTALGDIIFSEMVYQYDEGKLSTDEFLGDHRQNSINDDWLRHVQDMSSSDNKLFGQPNRVSAERWLLDTLGRGIDPLHHPARDRYFTPKTWSNSITKLQEAGTIAISAAGIRLSKTGVTLVDAQRILDISTPTSLPIRYHVGPIASGNAVVKDGATWRRLQGQGVRSVLGLEMEAATIGNIAHRQGVSRWLVVKGVMDHANPSKDDRYKAFAASAAAYALYSFIDRQAASLFVLSNRSKMTNGPPDLQRKPVRHSLIDARSTNDEAVRLINAGETSPFLVHTWVQTQGRGKGDNVWVGGAGILTATWVHSIPKSVISLDALGRIGIISALAISDVVKYFIPPSRVVQVKWPNDVTIDGGKVSGVLVEMREELDAYTAIIGIGINVSRAPAIKPSGAFSMPPASIFENHFDDQARERQIEEVISRVTIALGGRLSMLVSVDGWAEVRSDWKSLDSLTNKVIRIYASQHSDALTAKYGGIDEEGQLLAFFEGGKSKSFHTADVVRIEGRDEFLSSLPQDPPNLANNSDPLPGDIRAVVPGFLAEIFVGVGESVHVGSRLFVIEAMKMANVVTSKVEGVVVSVFKSAGEIVEFNESVLQVDVIDP